MFYVVAVNFNASVYYCVAKKGSHVLAKRQPEIHQRQLGKTVVVKWGLTLCL